MYQSSSPSMTAMSTPSEDFKNFPELHKRFNSILEEIRDAAPEIEDEFGDSEEDSDSDPLYGNELTNVQELQILVREILQVQEDVKNLYDYLHSKRSNDREEVAKLSKQLNDLANILDGQLTRAEKLVKKYQSL